MTPVTGKDIRQAQFSGDTSTPLLSGCVGEHLRRIAQLFPDRPALLWADGPEIARLTYAQLLQESERVAGLLLLHARPGERVAIWSRNSLEWVLLEYGCALAGMVVTAWNPAWTDAECAHARDLADSRLLFAGLDMRGMDLQERAKGLGSGSQVFPLPDLRGLAASAASPSHRGLSAADDLFLLQFTSGTTGRPKAAALTHRASLNAAWLRAQLYGADADDVWLNPVPLTHVGGAITVLLGAMLTGGAYVVMNRFDAGEFVRLMAACGATRIGGVPTMLLAVLNQPSWQSGTTRIRSIGLGGAQVQAALIERLQTAFGAPVLVTYGQSECSFVTSSLPGDPPFAVLETVGRVAPHTELKICNPETGRSLGLGEVGEIRVRAPTMMRGYFRMLAATDAVMGTDGFLCTGDLGSVDSRGYLRIHGRARDVIIRGGENIYPAEIEAVLLDHPFVAQAAVVGIADVYFGQIVGAVIVLRDGAVTTGPELERFAAEQLSHFKVPRQWRFVDSLPHTASGKVRKVELEAGFDRAAP